MEGVKFWDGGLANNNPVLEVLAEQSQLYPQRPVNCMISPGTGFSERKASKSTLAVIGKGTEKRYKCQFQPRKSERAATDSWSSILSLQPEHG